jgi:hypothetical protein
VADHLSDPDTRRFKLRQTSVLVLSVAAVCAWQYLRNVPRPSADVSILVATLMAVAMTLTVRRLFWLVADDVVLQGATLVAQRGSRTVTVHASDVLDVVPVPFNLRQAVAIELRSPTAPFGGRIVFLPLGWRHSSAQHASQLAELLKSRLLGTARATDTASRAP